MSQPHDEVLELWDALPQHTRDWLQCLIVRDLPDARDGVLVEVDIAPNDDDPDDTLMVITSLSSGHMYAASWVPRPVGVSLH